MEGHMSTRRTRSTAQGFEKTSAVTSADNLFEDNFNIDSSSNQDEEDIPEKEEDPIKNE
jgi:hypothetical protein